MEHEDIDAARIPLSRRPHGPGDPRPMAATAPPLFDPPSNRLYVRFVGQLENLKPSAPVTRQRLVALVAEIARRWIVEMDPVEASTLRKRIRRLTYERNCEENPIRRAARTIELNERRRRLVFVAGEAPDVGDSAGGKRMAHGAPPYKIIAELAAEVCVAFAGSNRHEFAPDFDMTYRDLFRKVTGKSESAAHRKWRSNHRDHYVADIARRTERLYVVTQLAAMLRLVCECANAKLRAKHRSRLISDASPSVADGKVTNHKLACSR